MNHMIQGDSGTHPSSPNYDPRNEVEETKVCVMCEDLNKESETVLDFIQENRLCNRKRCIEWSKEQDVANIEGSEKMKAEEYYNNLLKQLK